MRRCRGHAVWNSHRAGDAPWRARRAAGGAGVAAAETYSGQSRGDFASGWFSSETQCIPGDEPEIASWGYVQMGDNVSHTRAGKPVSGEYAYLYSYQYDACSGEFLG